MTELERARLKAVFREDAEIGGHWTTALVHVFCAMKALEKRGWSVGERLRALQELSTDMFQQFESTMREPADD